MTDVFDTQRDRNVIDLATQHDVATRRQRGRTVFVGLTWSFGGGKNDFAENKFDYATGAP